MSITFKKLSLTVAIWGAIFAVLSALHFSPLGLLNIIGFPFLLFVPGYFVVLLLNMQKLSGPIKFLFSVAFSLALLIFWPLLGNTILPLLHIARPLENAVLLPQIALLLVILWALLGWRNKWQFNTKLDVYKFVKPAKIDIIFALTPLIFVALSIMGALSLNNGGSNIFTVIMLVGITIYVGALIYMAERLRQGTLLVALFFVSLSLLFMTSLRGWYITGHDVQHEFRLFVQTIDAGKWAMGVAKDAYNACLSVTLLPTVFYKMLDVQNYYVFKVLFQIIFAFVPGLVLLLSQEFLKGLTQRTALLATLYFVAFPTFFTDMPMLNRQEIALLFAGLMIWLVFNRSLALWVRRTAFLVMGVSVIVSHYSTNYTMLALITACVFAVPLLRVLAKKLKPSGKIYRTLNLDAWRKKTTKSLVTLPMLIILLGASFVWSVQLTNTSGQLTKVFFDTIAHIQQAIGGDSPSQDTYFSYDTVNKLSDQDKLYRYFEQLSLYGRQRNGEEAYYPADSYAQYTFPIASTQTVQTTSFGAWLQHIGVPVQTLQNIAHNNVARILQLLIVWGLALVLFAKKFKTVFTNEYRGMQIGAVLLIGGMLALPVLLADYDLSRMLQQLLFIVGVTIVIGSMYLLPKISAKLRVGIASALLLIIFSVTSGVWTAIFGGYNATVYLYNYGIYYDLYYTHREEQVGAAWLNNLLGRVRSQDLQTDSVFVDRYTSFKVQSAVQQDLLNDVYPGLVRKNAYVFLGYAMTTKQQATAYYNGALISYKYPMQFLDDNKNLLYDNGGSKVYK